MDNATIVDLACRAYLEEGFSGLVAWHYYNEPLLQMERMFHLMETIKKAIPQARFLLWTNGVLLPHDMTCFSSFELVCVSVYTPRIRLYAHLLSRVCPVCLRSPELDDRIERKPPPVSQPGCLRPLVEVIVDAYGNMRLCCYDWRGEACLGNIHKLAFGTLLQRRDDWLRHIAATSMGAEAPPACLACGHRWSKIQEIVPDITRKGREWVQNLRNSRVCMGA